MSCPEQEVIIPIDGRTALNAELCVPETARGIVLFAGGTGTSRHSTRSRNVAELLQQRGFATMLIDLLTQQEERADRWNHALRFDIPLLGGRLLFSMSWLLP